MKPAEDDARMPIVPFVPFRCPKCQKHKPRTYGQGGRIRWHVCQACGQRYKSMEIDPRDLRDPERLRELLGSAD